MVSISQYTFRSSTWLVWVKRSCVGKGGIMGKWVWFQTWIHIVIFRMPTLCAHTAPCIVSCHHPHIHIQHTQYRRHCVETQQQDTGPMLASLFLSLLLKVKQKDKVTVFSHRSVHRWCGPRWSAEGRLSSAVLRLPRLTDSVCKTKNFCHCEFRVQMLVLV